MPSPTLVSTLILVNDDESWSILDEEYWSMEAGQSGGGTGRSDGSNSRTAGQTHACVVKRALEELERKMLDIYIYIYIYIIPS